MLPPPFNVLVLAAIILMEMCVVGGLVRRARMRRRMRLYFVAELLLALIMLLKMLADLSLLFRIINALITRGRMRGRIWTYETVGNMNEMYGPGWEEELMGGT